MRTRLAVAGAAVLCAVATAAITERDANAHAQPATSATTAASAHDRQTPAFEAHVLADHLVAPWAIGFLPDGRVLFTERAGRVRIIAGDKLQPEPALVVSDIKQWIKMGLLGLAVDPDFANNHFVYLAECYGGSEERDSWVRVVRYEMRGEQLVEPKKLIDAIPAYLNHAGGRLAFGPDGKLYITTGDADRPPVAQDLNSLGGKILRINTDGSIPGDNPFVHHPSAQPAIWSYGHRNSQGLAFEPGTGKLFASEHGPDGGDEVNVIRGGANYGWPTVSHDRLAADKTPSLAEYTPAIGPADATFYNGAMFPELRGDLLIACLRGEALLRITLDDKSEKILQVERLLHRTFGRIREVAVAPDGALWITTSEIDPPEGRDTDGYDQVIRLTRGEGVTERAEPRPVGGVALYTAHCASCHGTPSRPGENSSLFDRQWEFGSNDNAIRRNIADGVGKMVGFKSRLTPDEINEVLRFVRNREQLYGR